ncbi:hypothetical protein CBR_g29292 [Chara braunii]|uniref:SH3 domain-containing protein n=1 Tax=Chara braunii TaxID=69332 RepID=A0A388LA94_CHABU|nr:hypothetical protein CBR_g29292 [Chara braunii]|eukprot:GBG79241.1 hypothetical protein CBR_g29292 [Chara braunii]
MRDQVTKQQAAVLGKFGHKSESNVVIIDEHELQRHQQLERLSASTSMGKAFQRDIVKAVDGLVGTGNKTSEVATKLADDCRRYSTEISSSSNSLKRGAQMYSQARGQVEMERDMMHRYLGLQVVEPLKAMVMGAPLEEARALMKQYERVRQEAQIQANQLYRRQSRARESGGDGEISSKIQEAEMKMEEYAATLSTLGKETASALIAVEAQQQKLTLQRLIAMVELERAFYLKGAEILEQVLAQMNAERSQTETTPPMGMREDVTGNASQQQANGKEDSAQRPPQNFQFFLAEVMFPFEAEATGEMSLTKGDFVVVRQVTAAGWAEGECKGKAGWFPATFVEHRQRVPASKIMEVGVTA